MEIEGCNHPQTRLPNSANAITFASFRDSAPLLKIELTVHS